MSTRVPGPAVDHAIARVAEERAKPAIALVVKRVADVVCALALLTVLLLPMLIIALLVRLRLGSPVLFTQERAGWHGRSFRMVKFRTMRDAVDSSGRPLPDDQRMTRLGSTLRALSLDELPELWNVLKGDMSLVGPRPLYVHYLPRYSPAQARRHEMRPGITGWAQVNGRNAVSWPKRFEMDVWYVDHWSLALDWRVLWLTVRAVAKRTGVSAEGHVTMPEFTGTETDELRS